MGGLEADDPLLTPKGSKQKKETTLNISVFTIALMQ